MKINIKILFEIIIIIKLNNFYFLFMFKNGSLIY